MNPLIQKVSVDAGELRDIIFDRLEPALRGVAFTTRIPVLLTAAILYMKPNITPEELERIVLSASENIVMQLMLGAAPSAQRAN